MQGSAPFLPLNQSNQDVGGFGVPRCIDWRRVLRGLPAKNLLSVPCGVTQVYLVSTYVLPEKRCND